MEPFGDEKYVYLIIRDGDALLEAKMRPEMDANLLRGQLEPLGFACELKPTGFHPCNLPHDDPRHVCSPANEECLEWIRACRMFTSGVSRQACTHNKIASDRVYADDIPNTDCESPRCTGRAR